MPPRKTTRKRSGGTDDAGRDHRPGEDACRQRPGAFRGKARQAFAGGGRRRRAGGNRGTYGDDEGASGCGRSGKGPIEWRKFSGCARRSHRIGHSLFALGRVPTIIAAPIREVAITTNIASLGSRIHKAPTATLDRKSPTPFTVKRTPNPIPRVELGNIVAALHSRASPTHPVKTRETEHYAELHQRCSRQH